jgi:hypothetical protein
MFLENAGAFEWSHKVLPNEMLILWKDIHNQEPVPTEEDCQY